MPREPCHRMGVPGRGALAIVGGLAASFVASPVAHDAAAVLGRPANKLDRKGGSEPASRTALLGTLVDTHSPVRIPIDDFEPTQARFDELLRDPVLGAVHATDPSLLGLVRALAARHPLARIDVVSGFRSPKLNEALRKKGHHVASHSQHTLGHAIDLRVASASPCAADAAAPIDPSALAAEIRGLGWAGGVGIYLQPEDRFVHADVGPLRTWYGK